MKLLAIMALLAGAAIAIQANMNARLGVLLSNPFLATCIAFFFAFLVSLFTTVMFSKEMPSGVVISAVPKYLWFCGGLISAFGVAAFYFLIPKMGVSSMMSYALTGQIVIAVVAAHFGWLELPVKSINLTRTCGLIALVVGIFLINKES
ncbi:MAG: DMT family transporter [Kangiellaceae bacterium]|nr:DMT family transporter [Kangiellaceae bacterium]